jgi:hypothetical protein
MALRRVRFALVLVGALLPSAALASSFQGSNAECKADLEWPHKTVTLVPPGDEGGKATAVLDTDILDPLDGSLECHPGQITFDLTYLNTNGDPYCVSKTSVPFQHVHPFKHQSLTLKFTNLLGHRRDSDTIDIERVNVFGFTEEKVSAVACHPLNEPFPNLTNTIGVRVRAVMELPGHLPVHDDMTINWRAGRR